MKQDCIKSLIYWHEPPQPGQPLEELEWSWLDFYEDGARIRPEPPTQEEIDQAIMELRPYFSTKSKDKESSGSENDNS
jgi:hypothetical protein